MKRILVAALLALCALGANSETLVARQGNDSVRLTEAPCTYPQVVARLQPDAVVDYRAATAVFQGQSFQACWKLLGDSAHLVYEDGDQGLIPSNDLKPELTL